MLRALLSHHVTRLALTTAIIVSLLPSPVILRLDGLFLLVFLPELFVRVFLIFREEGRDDLGGAGVTVRRGWRRPSRPEVIWVALDAVALLAFLPPEWVLVGVSSARTLRLFRLVRLLLLFRIWAPMVVDLYTVLSRAERLRQVWLMLLASVLLSFAGAVVIDQVGDNGVDFDGDGAVGGRNDARFLVRLWWSFRQIEDPGNLMTSPSESVVLVVSIALTVFGLFLVSFLIGLGTDVVRELMALSRLRAPGLSGHTVVVNITPATRQLLVELLQHYEKLAPEEWNFRSLKGLGEFIVAARRRRQFLVVGVSEDPPEFLREPRFRRVVYRQAPVHDDAIAMIRRTDLQRAKRVVMLADLYRSEPDAATIRTLLNISASMQGTSKDVPRPRLFAEVVDESSVGAAHRATASYARSLTQIVTTESLVGLFLACAVRHPHSEEILSTLLTSEGWEIYTYSLDYLEGLDGAPPHASVIDDTDYHRLRKLLSSSGGTKPRSPVLLGSLVRDSEDAETGGPGERASVRAVFGDAGHSNCREGDSRVGLIMLAPNFREVRECMSAAAGGGRSSRRSRREAGEGTSTPVASSRSESELLVMAPTTHADRVLVCGYRPGSVDLLESLAVAYPGATILFVAGSTDANLRRACDDLDAHRGAVLRRSGVDRGGFFEAREDLAGVLADTGAGGHACFRYVYGDRSRVPSKDGTREGAREGAQVVVAQADWSSSRVLAELPCGFGAAFEMDAVVLCADESREGDARTLTALMKLEELFGSLDAVGSQRGTERRLVVEVDDEDLATRLRARFARLQAETHGGGAVPFSVSVYALPALRAYFMFQSVVVPHFDLVFQELLGPWGESLAPLEIAKSVAPSSVVSMRQIDAAVLKAGGTMIGLEYEDEDGAPAFWVGRPPAGMDLEVSARSVTRVWAVIPDSMDLPTESASS